MANNNVGVPSWLWVTTPLVTVSFVTAMFFLGQVPASDELDAVKGDAKAALQSGIERAKKDIEDAANNIEYQYEFYQLLEQQTIEVPEIDAYRSTPKGASPKYQYRLQAGSFRSDEDANRLRSQLLLEGLPAYQETNQIGEAIWHRVFVGPFTDRSKLNRAQDTLADFNISPLLLKSTVAEG